MDRRRGRNDVQLLGGGSARTGSRGELSLRHRGRNVAVPNEDMTCGLERSARCLDRSADTRAPAHSDDLPLSSRLSMRWLNSWRRRSLDPCSLRVAGTRTSRWATTTSWFPPIESSVTSVVIDYGAPRPKRTHTRWGCRPTNWTGASEECGIERSCRPTDGRDRVRPLVVHHERAAGTTGSPHLIASLLDGFGTVDLGATRQPAASAGGVDVQTRPGQFHGYRSAGAPGRSRDKCDCVHALIEPADRSLELDRSCSHALRPLASTTYGLDLLSGVLVANPGARPHLRLTLAAKGSGPLDTGVDGEPVTGCRHGWPSGCSLGRDRPKECDDQPPFALDRYATAQSHAR